MEKYKLIKNTNSVCNEDTVIFCFPFAGASASIYNKWVGFFIKEAKVCPIQLPGREERILDAPYEKMEHLLVDLEDDIKLFNKNKIILFGHSMGGKLAYETGKRLEKQGLVIEHLIVSGSCVPHIPEKNPIHKLKDDDFLNEVKKFNGIPKEILKDNDILNFFLPILRSDFKLDETYYSKEVTALSCPITALGGLEDIEASLDEILKWKEYTKSVFNYEIFKGGHFFIKEQEIEVLKKIKKLL